MTPIKNSCSFSLFGLTSGKKDPKSLSDAYVFQSKQKGPTCYYYAMNMLRERIGKVHPPEKKAARKIEALISHRRKEITAMRSLLDYEKALAEELSPEGTFSHFNAWHKKGAEAFYAEIKKREITDTRINPIKKLISEFLTNTTYETLLEFTEEKHHQLCLDKGIEFLSLFGKNAQDMYKIQFPDTCFYKTTPWDDLSTYAKRAHVENFCFQMMYTSYNLSVSSWHPASGVKGLIETLNKSGPMYVKGHFSKDSTTLVSKEPKEISGLSIYSLDEKIAFKGSFIFHSVVITGAEMSTKSIFFVDPGDDSDPKKEKYKKTYTLSYDSFLSRLGNLKNFYFEDKSSEEADAPFYGLHAPS